MHPKLISCRVMVDELKPFLPEQIAVEILEISLHSSPDQLQQRLQQAIDAADGLYDPIYLGYGMCSKAVLGLAAEKSRLIVPKSDDCIEIFLGSRQARLDEVTSEPGTYFLTQGYIGDRNSMVSGEYERALARYGKERAEKLLRTMMSHYKRLVYIRMPNQEALEPDREYAQAMADRFGLRYEEKDGTPEWLRRMMAQQWGEDFVVVQPGERIELKHFYSA